MKQITKANGNIITFDYDPIGNRIAKHVQTGVGKAIVASTFYTLDAQGNTICVYEVSDDNPTSQVHLTERNIYGSSRVGQEQMDKIMNAQPMFTGTSYMANNFIGDKHYELSNHLGNVLVVVTDRKFPEKGTGTFAEKVAYYNPDVVSCSDYYPFGMQMEGRYFVVSQYYRYGFNGMEGDDEVKGSGNSYDFGARMYDSRVGRFLSKDALEVDFPSYSTYSFAYNSPLVATDPTGNSGIIVVDPTTKTVTISSKLIFTGKINKKEARSWAKEIENEWNSAKGVVVLKSVDANGVEQQVEYKVIFEVSGEKVSKSKAKRMQESDDEGLNNYIEVSNESGTSYSDVGGNTATWKNGQISYSPSTKRHEFGHLIGWFNKSKSGREQFHDMDGENGKPGTMTPGSDGEANSKNTLFKEEYYLKTQNPVDIKPLDANKRSLPTQRDIDMLNLEEIVGDGSKGTYKINAVEI